MNMIKLKKKVIIVAVALCMILVSGLVLSRLLGVSFAYNMFMDNSGVYIITSDSKMEVQFADVFNDSDTTVVIPATIKIKGNVYNVTSIKAEA